MRLRFVPKPQELPAVPETGRLALIDLAFANGDAYDRVTRPFIEAAGDRIAVWVDHHDHEAWRAYRDDPRFVLVPKTTARACPELIEPAVVEQAGRVDHLWAHADFDGCVAAAKFLNGGHAPYPEADEDARWADAPGRGYTVSARGKRWALALDEASNQLSTQVYLNLMKELCRAMVDGREPAALTERLDRFNQALVHRQARLREEYLDDLTRPHPELLLLDLSKSIEKSEKKFLLREMEERARVAVVIEKGHVTAATFFDDEEGGLDLRRVPGLKGQRGFAWGRTSLDDLVGTLGPQLDRLGPRRARG